MAKVARRKRGRPLKDRRNHLLIAATTDYRGDHDDELCFVFRGAGHQLISDTFHYLVGHSHGIAQRAVVFDETDVIRRNGKGFFRTAVQLVEPDFGFCSVSDMKILIEATLKRLHPCDVHWLDINEFLNV